VTQDLVSLIAEFVPGLAVIAPPPAGAMRIGWRKFIVLSTLSAAIWVAAGHSIDTAAAP